MFETRVMGRCSAGSIVAAVALLGAPTNACIDQPLATPTMVIKVRRACEARLCFQGYVTTGSVAGDQCAVAFDVSGLTCVTSVEGIGINDATGAPLPGFGDWLPLARVGAGFDRIAEKLGEFGTAFAGYKSVTDADIDAGIAVEICVRVGTSTDCTSEDLEAELLSAGFLLGAADTNDDGELGANVSIEPIAGVDLIESDPCPQDADGSGSIDIGDILEVLVAWGPCDDFCPVDFDCSGAVGFEEILAILPVWGACLE